MSKKIYPDVKSRRRASYQRNKLIWLDSLRRRRYGIGNADVQQMIDRQRGICPITLKTVSIVDCLDHCHTSGKVRGVLSKRANIMLGFIEKNPEDFKRALEYLKEHGSL